MAVSKIPSPACVRSESASAASALSCPRGLTLPAPGTEMEEPRITAVVSVAGMTCSACAVSIEKAIKRLPGIVEAAIDVVGGRGQVTFSPAFVNEENILEAIEDAGFEAKLIKTDSNEASLKICMISIEGMSCTNCSNTIESTLCGVHGVTIPRVALATEKVEIHYNPLIITHNQLLEIVESIGFQAILISAGDDTGKVHFKVEGVTPDHSWRTIQQTLQTIPGVEEVEVDPSLQKVSLSYNADLTGPRKFIQVIECTESGRFKVMLLPESEGRGADKDKQIKNQYISFLWSLFFTAPVFLTSMVFMSIPGTVNYCRVCENICLPFHYTIGVYIHTFLRLQDLEDIHNLIKIN